ncbi:MAG: GNAT family N-acetyltransferase [Thermoplasmata archaeon]|nr:GNAT family N-acetyltransferase [Thermoplasmata archaeon]
MDGRGAPIDGPQVRLRLPRAEDHPLLFDWYNDAERVAPYDRFAVDTYTGFQRALLEAAASLESMAPRYLVERRSDAKLLGFVGYYRAHPVLTILDVWYVLGEPGERGKGYGSEAVGLLVGHLFRTHPVERVGATCDVDNLASVRLLEKLHFTREGTLRTTLFHHGRWHDAHVDGLTRAEWAAEHPSAGN